MPTTGMEKDRRRRLASHINSILCREFAVFKLADGANPDMQITAYFLQAELARSLSVIEAIFRVIHERYSAKNQIAELNFRFRQHAVGFEFSSGNIIRVDSLYVHAEVVKPALVLLSSKGFQGANAEFRAAHKHYLEANYKESLNEALKAFESTMKCIDYPSFDQKSPQVSTAKQLIEAMMTAGVLPESLGWRTSRVFEVRSSQGYPLSETASPGMARDLWSCPYRDTSLEHTLCI